MIMVRVRVRVSISFYDQDFVFFMKSAIDCWSNWHRLLQTESSVQGREDCVGAQLLECPTMPITQNKYITLNIRCFVDGLCDGQFDMGIIVDSSDSIGIQNFMVLVNDLKAVVDMSDISPQETRMGIIEYSSHARLITSFAHSQSAGNT